MVTYHMRAKSFPKVVSSILEANVTSLFAIEAFGKDANHTQVDEQADEQRQRRLYAEVRYGFLLSGHLGAIDVPAFMQPLIRGGGVGGGPFSHSTNPDFAGLMKVPLHVSSPLRAGSLNVRSTLICTVTTTVFTSPRSGQQYAVEL